MVLTVIQAGNRTALIRWLLLACVVFGLASYVQAQQILPEDEIESVGLEILKQEIDTFSTIQDGVKLSVAECELFDDCNANVNKGEIEQLLNEIDSRINLLSTRYSAAGEPELEQILIGYVDIRDGYDAIIDKLEDIPQFEHQLKTEVELEQDMFGADTGEVSDDLLELFMDADEELVDDEVFIEDEL